MLWGKTLLVLGSVGTIIQMILWVFGHVFFDACYTNTECLMWLKGPGSNLSVYTLIFIPVLLFFILTYRTERLFRTWSRFAAWGLIASLLSVFIAPEYSKDWMFPIDKGFVAFASAVVFSLISLAIMAWKYRQKA